MVSGDVTVDITSTPARTQAVHSRNFTAEDDAREAIILLIVNGIAAYVCCLCLGIGGMFMAYKSRIAVEKGRAESAKSYRYRAKFYYWTAVAVGLVIWMYFLKKKDCF